MVLGQSGVPTVCRTRQYLPVTGFAMIGGDPHPFMYQFPGLMRNVQAGTCGRRPRPVHDPAGVRRPIRRVPMIMLAQGRMLPSLTFDLLRIATGGDTILIRATRRASRAWSSRALKSRPTATARFGCTSRRDPTIYVSADEC